MLMSDRPGPFLALHVDLVVKVFRLNVVEHLTVWPAQSKRTVQVSSAEDPAEKRAHRVDQTGASLGQVRAIEAERIDFVLTVECFVLNSFLGAVFFDVLNLSQAWENSTTASAASSRTDRVRYLAIDFLKAALAIHFRSFPLQSSPLPSAALFSRTLINESNPFQ